MIYNIYINDKKQHIVESKNYPTIDKVFLAWTKFYVVAEMCENDVYIEEITPKEYCERRQHKNALYWIFWDHDL